MIGTLDRTLETALCNLIDTEAADAGLCVPMLLGEGDADAVCPRVIVQCESGESPDFQETADGIYGIFPVTTVVTCMVEARHASSGTQMQALTTAVDSILIYDGGLVGQLTSGTLRVFGVVPKGIRQEMNGDRLLRHREILVWARLQPITSAPMLHEDGSQMQYEDGGIMYTE